MVALLGERITGIKAFSVEVSLAQITVPVQVDLTHAVMAMAEMGPSGSPELLATFQDAIRSQARLLRLNLRNDDYWWSTRVYLAAALATDYTKVEQLVFVRGQEERLWVGTLIRRPRVPGRRGVPSIRTELPDCSPGRGERRRCQRAPRRRCRDYVILMNWPGQFGWLEDQTKQIVTSDLLRRWLGTDLDTEALPHGPLTPLLQYQVNMRSHRYTALATEGRLMAVVNKSELATRTTEEVLRRQLA